MFKVNNRNTRTRCEICSKLTVKIPKRRHWLCTCNCWLWTCHCWLGYHFFLYMKSSWRHTLKNRKDFCVYFILSCSFLFHTGARNMLKEKTILKVNINEGHQSNSRWKWFSCLCCWIWIAFSPQSWLDDKFGTQIHPYL